MVAGSYHSSGVDDYISHCILESRSPEDTTPGQTRLHHLTHLPDPPCHAYHPLPTRRNDIPTSHLRSPPVCAQPTYHPCSDPAHPYQHPLGATSQRTRLIRIAAHPSNPPPTSAFPRSCKHVDNRIVKSTACSYDVSPLPRVSCEWFDAHGSRR